jgi:3-methylcrotonyl-CoA carboxylase alpha subunit
MSNPRAVVLEDSDGSEHRVEIHPDGTLRLGDRTIAVTRLPDGSFRLESDVGRQVWAVATDDVRWVFLDGHVYTFEARAATAAPPRTRRGSRHHGSLAAPMPATVRRVQVAAGDRVRRGDVLIVLEAMKMEMPVRATADGVITAINCREGDMVQPGEELIEIGENGSG